MQSVFQVSRCRVLTVAGILIPLMLAAGIGTAAEARQWTYTPPGGGQEVKSEPPSITPIERGIFEAPSFETEFKLRAAGKEVVVGQRLLDIIVGKDLTPDGPLVRLGVGSGPDPEVVAKYLGQLERQPDAISRVEYLKSLYGGQTVTTDTLKRIVTEYRNGYLTHRALELHSLLSVEPPDPKRTLNLLRETLANRPKDQAYEFQGKFESLHSRSQSSSSLFDMYTRTSILDAVEEHMRRKLDVNNATELPPEFTEKIEPGFTTAPAGEEARWLLTGFAPGFTCHLISEALRNLREASDSPRRTPSRLQVALVNHILNVLAILSTENRQKCEREWRRRDSTPLEAAVTEEVVFIDPKNRQRVANIFRATRQGPLPWVREVFPVVRVSTSAPASSFDQDLESRQPNYNSYEPGRFDFDEMIERATRQPFSGPR